MRNLVFVGNCQSQALINVFNQFICPLTNDKIHFIHIDAKRNSADEAKLRGADIIVRELVATASGFTFHDLKLGARIVAFPQVAAKFLFPFGEATHPRNNPIPYRAQGPFPNGDADSYINGLLEQGLARDEAIRRYRDLDIAAIAELGRIYEASMMLQRNLDEECGTDFATLVENSFREEDCFHSAYYPKLPIFRHILTHVFDALEVARPVTDRILNSLGRTQFSLAEVPIHPGVAAYFGLKYYDPKARYRRFTSESLDFDAYWKAYIDYSWNNDLLVGIARACEPRLTAEERDALIEQLRRGIANSPGAPDASYALSTLLERSGRLDEALIAAQEAVAMEPGHSPFSTQLAKILLRLSRADEAERAAREAIRVGPAYADAYRQLRQILSFLQRWQDAAAAAEDVIALDPRRDDDWRAVGTFWMRAGAVEKAETTFATALKLFPKSSTVMGGLADLRRQQDRLEEAAELAREAVRVNPFDLKEWWTLADCLIRLQREAEAEAVFLSTIERFPQVGHTYKCLADMKAKQQLLPEAEEWLRKAADLDPAHVDALANLLMQQGRFQEAENALLASRGVTSRSGSLLALAKARLALGDVEGAVEWATKASSAPFYDLAAIRFASDTLAAIPDLPRATAFLRSHLEARRHVADIATLLARLYRGAKQNQLATEYYLQALAARPQDARLRREVTLYLPLAGRLSVALELANEQVEAAPEDIEARVALGSLLLNSGDLRGARAEFEIASKLAPDDAKLAGLVKLTEPVNAASRMAAAQEAAEGSRAAKQFGASRFLERAQVLRTFLFRTKTKLILRLRYRNLIDGAWKAGLDNKQLAKLCHMYLAMYGVKSTIIADPIFDLEIPRGQFKENLGRFLVGCRDRSYLGGGSQFIDARNRCLNVYIGARPLVITPSPITSDLLSYSPASDVPILSMRDLDELAVALRDAMSPNWSGFRGTSRMVAAALTPLLSSSDQLRHMKQIREAESPA